MDAPVVDPNFDIVPTLRMFNGLMMDKAADEIEALRAENTRLTDANQELNERLNGREFDH